MLIIGDSEGADIIGWHEWPFSQRKATQESRTDLPPIHEPEPGLLDEEILPLQDDWMKGPKGVVQSHHVR